MPKGGRLQWVPLTKRLTDALREGDIYAERVC